MQITVNSTQLDASLAVNAYNYFKACNYREATKLLQDILDVEPQNWQARLILAVCFHRMEQNFASERALRYVYENCTDRLLKQKACSAMQSLAANIEALKTKPVEFGRFAETRNITPPIPLEVVLELR